MKKKIAMVGYFGWGNFGDELFLKVHRQRLGTVFDLSVANDLLEEPYFSRPVEEIVDAVDGLLIGGGDLLNPIRVSGLYWRQEFLEKPVFVYGLGVPRQSFVRQGVLDHYKKFFDHPNCKLVVARDKESYEWIASVLDIGDKLAWFPDPVCAMSRPSAVPPREKVLGVVMREHRSLDEDMSHLRRMIDKAKEYGYQVQHLVLANGRLGAADLRRAQMIASADEEILYSESLEDMCQWISSCSLVATIKFHGLVVASMYGVPAIAMSATPKNGNFLRMLERSEMHASYTDNELYQRVVRHPARIHNLVRASLYRRANEGYDVLRDAMLKAV